MLYSPKIVHRQVCGGENALDLAFEIRGRRVDGLQHKFCKLDLSQGHRLVGDIDVAEPAAKLERRRYQAIAGLRPAAEIPNRPVEFTEILDEPPCWNE